MKRNIFIVTLFMFITSISFSVSAQTGNLEDVVYLKNGSIIRGIIIEQVLNKSLKVQTKDGNVFVYNVADVEKITKEQAVGINKNSNSNYINSGQNYSNANYKNPGVAFLLSFLLPGGGQYYNGELVKGIVIDALWLISIGAILSEEDEGIAIGLLLSSANSIYSWIDAPVSANRINRRNYAIGLINWNLGNGKYLSLSPDIQLRNNFLSIASIGKPVSTIGLKLRLTL